MPQDTLTIQDANGNTIAEFGTDSNDDLVLTDQPSGTQARLSADGVDVPTITPGATYTTEHVGDGDSIQDALNATPEKIVIHAEYDPTVESFPITGSDPVHIHAGEGAVVDNPSTSSNVFEFDLGTNKPNEPLYLSNLQIKGGDDGIVLDNTRYSLLHNVDIETPSGRGIYIFDSVDASNSNLLINPTIEDPGGKGMRFDGNAILTQVIAPTVRNAGDYGIFVGDGGNSPTSYRQWGGQINDCVRGLRLDGGDGHHVSGLFLETNDDIGIDIRGGAGHVVEHIHANGDPTNGTWTVNINGGSNGHFRYINARDYSNGIFNVANGVDNDLYLSTHHTRDSTSLLSGTGATRIRSNGVIGGGPLGGVDLSTTTGQFDGDEARADGTSAATANAKAIWNGTGWDYRNPDGTVTP